MKNKFIPSLISIGNLVSGFISLVFTMNGEFIKAALMIILSMLLDGIDGLIARKLKLQSKIGKEIDSLSDLISFGIAPALLIYSLHFSQREIIGLIVVIPYIICAALRLAKFNLQPSKNYFLGLPTTIAGSFVASLIICSFNLSSLLISIVIIILAYLMVSSIHYPKLEHIVFYIRNYYKLFLMLFISILILLINPKKLIFLPLFAYILYGIKIWVLVKLKVKKIANKTEEEKIEMRDTIFNYDKAKVPY